MQPIITKVIVFMKIKRINLSSQFLFWSALKWSGFCNKYIIFILPNIKKKKNIWHHTGLTNSPISEQFLSVILVSRSQARAAAFEYAVAGVAWVIRAVETTPVDKPYCSAIMMMDKTSLPFCLLQLLYGTFSFTDITPALSCNIIIIRYKRCYTFTWSYVIYWT